MPTEKSSKSGSGRSLRCQDKTFEKRCLDEFWLGSASMKEILAKIDREVVPAEQAIRDFYNALAELNKQYKVVLVCDAPYYDVPMLSYYLDFFGYPPLYYKPTLGFAQEPVAQVVFESLPERERELSPQPAFSAVIDALAYGTGVYGHCIVSTGKQLNKDALVKKCGMDVSGVAHDHNPTNDAEYNLRLFFAVRAQEQRQ